MLLIPLLGLWQKLEVKVQDYSSQQQSHLMPSQIYKLVSLVIIKQIQDSTHSSQDSSVDRH